MTANELDEAPPPDMRMALFRVALGADEVPKAKPDPDGLLKWRGACRPSMRTWVTALRRRAARAAGMKAVGVLRGANGAGGARGAPRRVVRGRALADQGAARDPQLDEGKAAEGSGLRCRRR